MKIIQPNTQSKRQPGSEFLNLLFTLVHWIEAIAAASIINDATVVFFNDTNLASAWRQPMMAVKFYGPHDCAKRFIRFTKHRVCSLTGRARSSPNTPISYAALGFDPNETSGTTSNLWSFRQCELSPLQIATAAVFL